MSDNPGSSPAAGPPRSDLLVRAASGAVLAAISLAAVWAGPWPFGILLAGVSALASWEWSRIVRGQAGDSRSWLHIGAVVLAAIAAIAGYAMPALVGLIVIAIVMLILGWRTQDRLSSLGVIATGLPVLSLAMLRSDMAAGFEAALFVFLVVWATDIGGYVFGRTIGGPKLWPAVSPGKTWAGAFGGLVLAAAAAFGFAQFFPTADILGLVMAALLLGLAAELGDLAESALKRRFGLKDASKLIPGHGGVLDRVDGLMAAAVVAALLALLRNPVHPGAGLLFWP